MPTDLTEHEQMIFREMMTHPVLFTHPNPKELTIVGDENLALLQESLKHSMLTHIHHVKTHQEVLPEVDPRVQYYTESTHEFIGKVKSLTQDILINTATQDDLPLLRGFYQLLKPDGILLQQGYPLFQLDDLKKLLEHCFEAGFKELQILHFPTAQHRAGSQTAILARKQGLFKRIREKAIYSKNFTTYYYNLDMHKAATALPEFMRRDGSFQY